MEAKKEFIQRRRRGKHSHRLNYYSSQLLIEDRAKWCAFVVDSPAIRLITFNENRITTVAFATPNTFFLLLCPSAPLSFCISL